MRSTHAFYELSSVVPADPTGSALQAAHHPLQVQPFGAAAARLGWRVGVYSGYLGQGMIMGPRVVASMLAGTVFAFAVLAPLALSCGWADTESSGDNSAVAWVTWVSLAIMIADSLTSLALLLARYAITAARGGARGGGELYDFEADDVDDDSRAADGEAATLVAATGALLLRCD